MKSSAYFFFVPSLYTLMPPCVGSMMTLGSGSLGGNLGVRPMCFLPRQMTPGARTGQSARCSCAARALCRHRIASCATGRSACGRAAACPHAAPCPHACLLSRYSACLNLTVGHRTVPYRHLAFRTKHLSTPVYPGQTVHRQAYDEWASPSVGRCLDDGDAALPRPPQCRSRAGNVIPQRGSLHARYVGVYK